ncbi:Uncharacterized protein MSYG_0384 [Malassezia sympodialis ATCC 42132]|uniref:HpcH/HpaI aldolase/citrate lyase domain-containing protein n=1 Tax=Malassezia sympodialis (strain ATCC 42132) TaxID=1230383 RepID=A0A1M8A0Y6_MALS4|nr:Uncharacterized protein MSYG_0384 [Malassezia sympodialis ATCC 42132]
MWRGTALMRASRAVSHFRRCLSTKPSVDVRPRRSLLYVPGSSEKMLVKSRNVAADTLVYDLEDSVAEHRKGAAQHMVLQALQAAPEKGPELAVRINAPSTQRELAEEDLEVVLQSHRVQAVVVPKVESVDDLDVVARVAQPLSQYTPTTPLALVLSIESAAALLHMPQMLAQAQARMDDWEHRISLAALLFASEDYCAATRIKRTRDRRSLLFPRAQLVTTARAYGLQAIDMVCIEYKDKAYLEDECRDGADLGFDGKQVIHPAQLDAVNRAFSPSEEDIGFAQAIWDAYQRGVANNQGAVGLMHHGRELMIDAPMLLQAQQTLQRAGLLPSR